MESLWRDLRVGLRSVLARPAFTAVVVIVLALGIGVNATVFSALYAVVLRPLPYAAPERLTMVWQEYIGRDFGLVNVSYPNFTDLRAASRSFAELGVFSFQEFTVARGETVERITGARISEGMLEGLGVAPLHGRHFLGAEEEQTGARVAVIGHALWQTRFGGSPELPGGAIQLDGEPYTVVGIMPPGFGFPPAFTSTLDGVTRAVATPELWVPLSANDFPVVRERRIFMAMGRLQDGVALDTAQREADEVARRLAEAYPEANADLGFRLVPLHEQVVGDVRPTLLILFSAVSLVTLIACANVAGLLLTRASERRQEMAVRAALGAGRAHLARQFIAESVWLAVLGGAAGLALARAAVALLVAWGPADLPRLGEVVVQGEVLGFTAAISLLTGLVFGLAPAWQLSNPQLYQGLTSGGVAGTDRTGLRTRRVLATGQLASSVVLLAGAGLVIRSLAQLLGVNPGFDPQRLLTFHVFVPPAVAGPEGQRVALQANLMEVLQSLPGVTGAGTVSIPPLSARGEAAVDVEVESQPIPSSDERPQASLRPVSAGYFAAMAIPLLRGRALGPEDDGSGFGVTVINETMARTLFPGQDPLGRRVRAGDQDDWLTVVGVVADVRHFGLASPPRSELYVPYAQAPGRSFSVVLRTAGDPLALAPAARRAVAGVHPDLPVSYVEVMDDRVSASVAWPRLTAMLLGLFAAVALALAIVGVFGMVSHAVGQRTREVGLRVALGADRGEIIRLVVRGETRPIAWGIVLGLVGALALTHSLESALFGVAPNDPATLALVVLLLALAAALACVVPVIRATRVDPVIALRAE